MVRKCKNFGRDRPRPKDHGRQKKKKKYLAFLAKVGFHGFTDPSTYVPYLVMWRFRRRGLLEKPSGGKNKW
jgi:hypothetical protein